MNLSKLGYGIGLFSSLFLVYGTCETPILGPQGSQGLQGDQGPQGQRGDQGPQGPVALNGNRIKNTFMVSEDGVRVPIGFWDSLRNEACTFQAVSVGNFQGLICIPKLNPATYIYTDPSCSEGSKLLLYIGHLPTMCVGNNAKKYFIVSEPPANVCDASSDQLFQVQDRDKLQPMNYPTTPHRKVKNAMPECQAMAPADFPVDYELYNPNGQLGDGSMENKLLDFTLFSKGNPVHD